MHKKGFYESYIKRPIDFCCALIALIVLSPVLLIVAILVRVKLGTPVLFTQDRPGLNEKIFKLYKFRTMTSETDENGNLLPDEVRLTKFGKMLRSTSLDELPEFINILKGDMSFIGPRPLLEEYLPYYSIEEKKRHSVRPGLSGLAQINGRNFVGWDQRLQYDIQYVDEMSFKMDISIIIKTIVKIIKKQDVAVDTNKVEPNFAEERRNRQL